MKIAFFAAALSFAGAAWSAPIVISAAYSYPTAAPGVPGVGFLTVRNTAAGPDRLLTAESPSVERIEIHSSRVVDGVMQMRALSQGLALPSGETVSLEPGGVHLMLFGLKAPLQAGEHVPLTLVFERAGRIATTLDVRARESSSEASQPVQADHSHHGAHHDH